MVVEGSNAATYDTANRSNETGTQSGHRRTGELFGQSSGDVVLPLHQLRRPESLAHSPLADHRRHLQLAPEQECRLAA